MWWKKVPECVRLPRSAHHLDAERSAPVSMRRFAANAGESARLSETAAWQTPKASASFIPENVGERRAGNANLRLARANTGPYVPSDAANDAHSAMPAPLRRKDTGQFAQASVVIAAAAAGEAEP